MTLASRSRCVTRIVGGRFRGLLVRDWVASFEVQVSSAPMRRATVFALEGSGTQAVQRRVRARARGGCLRPWLSVDAWLGVDVLAQSRFRDEPACVDPFVLDNDSTNWTRRARVGAFQ